MAWIIAPSGRTCVCGYIRASTHAHALTHAHTTTYTTTHTHTHTHTHTSGACARWPLCCAFILAAFILAAFILAVFILAAGDRLRAPGDRLFFSSPQETGVGHQETGLTLILLAQGCRVHFDHAIGRSQLQTGPDRLPSACCSIRFTPASNKRSAKRQRLPIPDGVDRIPVLAEWSCVAAFARLLAHPRQCIRKDIADLSSLADGRFVKRLTL